MTPYNLTVGETDSGVGGKKSGIRDNWGLGRGLIITIRAADLKLPSVRIER